jgi:hypothetical protein
MKRFIVMLVAIAFLAGGTIASAKEKVVHRVSVGGNDICAALGADPGCDGNFSLVAIEKADGSVKGQWQDTFFGGGEGIHVAVDCLNVVDNGAVVGGEIVHGFLDGVDVTGFRALTAVIDNGKSRKDPPDQISYSFFPPGDNGLPENCRDVDPLDLPLFRLTLGQVTVK